MKQKYGNAKGNSRILEAWLFNMIEVSNDKKRSRITSEACKNEKYPIQSP